MRLIIPNCVLVSAVAIFCLQSATAQQPHAEVSPSPLPPGHHLQNISSRAQVQTGENVLIAGFIVRGNDPKNVIVRAIGPSLNNNGVPLAGRLADPTLELYAAGNSTPIAQNNDWRESQEAEITATGLAPSNGAESAIVRSLDAGQYTAIVRGNNGGTGVGLVEVYEVDQSSSLLANISTRGFVGTGDNALIAGLIVGGGEADRAIRVVIRAIGPSLAMHGVSGALQDPTLELFDANGSSIGSNDNWMDSPQESEIVEVGLAPENPLESALVATLDRGNYTAILRGKDGSTGTALIEVYYAPDNGVY